MSVVSSAGAIKAIVPTTPEHTRGPKASLTQRLSVLRINYNSFSHLESTRRNKIASLLFLALICCTTFISSYYLVWHGNIVQVQYVDTYAAAMEWLFNKDATGPLDPTIVENFIASDDTNDALRLKQALLTPPSRPIDPASPCVARLGQDPGSFYAFCGGLDRSRLPGWATNFDAHIIQTVNLATPAEFRMNAKRPVLAMLQGFKNTRNGWYEQKTIAQFYCTTRVMAQPSNPYSDRIIYTKLHGVLRSVDCSLSNETGGEACKLAMNLPAVYLFDDKTGSMPLVRPNEVLRDSKGKDFILCPFISTETIGALTKALPVWPIDDCLYVRGSALGWFGAGYMAYTVEIPTLALIAKVQLLSLVAVLWLVKYQCTIYCVHHALIQASRLGIFPVIAAQMLISAYWEQDIMRTIHSWKSDEHFMAWLLYLYIYSTVALACSMVALSLLRIAFDSSINTLGCWVAIIVPFAAMPIEYLLARKFYSSYTIENGLLAQPVNCAVGVHTCGNGFFNRLYLVVLLTFFPVLIEAYLIRTRRVRTSPNAIHVQLSLAKPRSLRKMYTSFESNCLDETEAREILVDCLEEFTIEINHVAHTTAAVISACGFTIIRQRFLVRTKDLVYLLFARFLPATTLRDMSLVIWPLQRGRNGALCAAPARRVFLQSINKIEIAPGLGGSLIASEDHPLA